MQVHTGRRYLRTSGSCRSGSMSAGLAIENGYFEASVADPSGLYLLQAKKEDR